MRSAIGVAGALSKIEKTNRVSRLQNIIDDALVRALDTVWLRQPRSARVIVPPSHRKEMRRARACIRGMLADARNLGPGCARDELAVAALERLLATFGRIAEPDAADDQEAIAGATARIDAALRSERLRSALGVARASSSGGVSLTEEQFGAVLDLCEWTDALIDDRSGRRKRVERFAAVATGAVALVALTQTLFGSRNLAYGRPVSASSVCGLAPPAPFKGSQLSRVVDGEIYEAPHLPLGWGEAAYATCTNAQAHPWLSVDLGKERTLSRAVVYGRSDCCWRDVLPLSIQVSTDDVHYETIATTKTPFTSEFPWKVPLDGRRARYVRLYIDSRKPRSIVVNELEVYGR